MPPEREQIEQDTGGEDVRPSIHFVAAQLLRRHVGDLALDLAGARRLDQPTCGLGYAEVHELGHALVRHQHVVRRYVTVHETERLAVVVAELVRCVQSATYLAGDAHGCRERHPPLPRGCAQDQVERLAVDPLHHEVEQTVLLAQVQDLRHVRMADARSQRGFVEEHLLEAWVVADRRQQGLDGDDLLEAARALEPGRPDRAHAALGDRQQQLVATEQMARLDVAERSYHRATSLPAAARREAWHLRRAPEHPGGRTRLPTTLRLCGKIPAPAPTDVMRGERRPGGA